jgi:hypothetical protein
MTVARYIAIVATAYSLVLIVSVVAFGKWDIDSVAAVIALSPLIAVGGAIAALGTLAAMARFGNAGGSIYAAPTAVHVMVLLVIVVVFAFGSRA